jgi:hypothetical protein
MPVDFFKADCQLNTNSLQFGICDDDNELPAYINHADANIWIATVINDNSKDIVFTSIDKCINFPLIEGNMQSRCDVMMTCDNCLYLVELKNKKSDWQSSGIEQLEATIINLINSIQPVYNNYRIRKAYVANRRHPSFHVIENEMMEKFRDKYQVRLDLQATINVL